MPPRPSSYNVRYRTGPVTLCFLAGLWNFPGRASISQALSLALASALAALSAGPGCLPDLDPSRIDVACRGSAPDGFLDPGEQCDDGNAIDGDGCDGSCRIECAPPSALDASTGHCYSRLDEALSADEAQFRCRTQGGQLATVRSPAELSFLASSGLLSPSGPLLLAYRVDQTSAPFLMEATASPPEVFEAVPSPVLLYGEPGLLDPGEGASPGCPGCYYGPPDAPLSPGFSQMSSAPFRSLALDLAGRMVLVDSSGNHSSPSLPAPSGALCERPPAGSPPNPCPSGPSCPQGASSLLRLGPSAYALFPSPSPWAEAEARCSSLGGHLWGIDDEPERERVVRALGLTLLGATRTWVGVRAGAWSDGQARPGFDPWAVAPTEGSCGAMLTQSSSYALGLLVPEACESARPFVCELP